MINLQQHLRSLSRARIELEDAAVDSLDDTDSSSESETGTVNIVGTPITDRLLHLECCSGSDSDDSAPVPSFPSFPPSSHHKQQRVMLEPIDINMTDKSTSDANHDIESIYDSQDSEVNDTHCLNDSSDSSVSPKSCSSKSSSMDPIHELQYDQELEALKEELNQFKRKNFKRLRRTRSEEEVLLSVLSIDKKDIDKKQLEKCAKKAIQKYNSWSMTQPRKKKKPTRRLADPYEEEWNGLNPDDYVWFDNVPEGQCYDDKELSLRNRRMQYLVVMAIHNNYCSISDLTYKQNELLLLYQQSLNF
eukprot:511224_1